jgi:hypothetical protein
MPRLLGFSITKGPALWNAFAPQDEERGVLPLPGSGPGRAGDRGPADEADAGYFVVCARPMG